MAEIRDATILNDYFHDVDIRFGELDIMDNNVQADDKLVFNSKATMHISSTVSDDIADDEINETSLANSISHGTPYATVDSHATQLLTLSSASSSNVADPPLHPVSYSRYGEDVVIEEMVVIRQADGSQVIETERFQPVKQRGKHLRRSRIRCIQAFSIVALILFFPTGIPAVYYAFKIYKEFLSGILRGDIDRATTYAKLAERMTVLSIVLAIVTLMIVVPIFAKPTLSVGMASPGSVAYPLG